MRIYDLRHSYAALRATGAIVEEHFRLGPCKQKFIFLATGFRRLFKAIRYHVADDYDCIALHTGFDLGTQMRATAPVRPQFIAGKIIWSLTRLSARRESMPGWIAGKLGSGWELHLGSAQRRLSSSCRPDRAGRTGGSCLPALLCRSLRTGNMVLLMSSSCCIGHQRPERCLQPDGCLTNRSVNQHC
jgi:hypothetical protein